MTCTTLNPLLPELAAGELAGRRAEEAHAHLATCAACTKDFKELSATIALLRGSGDAPLPDGFERELHMKLVAAAAERPRSSWIERAGMWLSAHPLALASSAAALSAVLAVGTTLAVVDRQARPAAATLLSQPSFQVPESKVALVKIDFLSAHEIDDVSFEVLLPDGLHFYSQGQELAERSFQWSGKLGTGSNVVPIAVKGLRPGRYHVIAHATGQDLDVTQDVVLEVTS